ncbi:LacI family DNA-binding transcriptional regulator [Catenulispora sp. EB89]|uniref:LacI family DNA-binding transcriptional regulator n=1 Tax=Catenulispora sp. EB89 TaxID=3156257 RepID=UPI0035113080
MAQRAGVSKAAASKVLNGVQDFSARPETRLRIMEAAEALGYRPHVAARALATSNGRTVALLVPKLTDLAAVTIARGAFERAAERGYVLVMSEDFDEHSAMSAFRDLVHGGRVDGLIVASSRPEHKLIAVLAESTIPHVFLDRAVPGTGRNVVLDVAGSSRLALRHLAGLGHRDVAHIAGPPGITPSDDRARAFTESALAHGLTVCHVEHAEPTEAGGAEAAAAIIGAGRATAVYASSLAQAIGAVHAAHEAGLAVPDALSVIGNDDFPIAAYLTPPLTTIAMPLWELGRYGADAIIDQLEGTAPADVVIPTEPTLVVRGSTGPPGSR